MEIWDRLPEWVQWLLYLPALVLSVFFFALIMTVSNHIVSGAPGSITSLFMSGVVAWVFIEQVFAMAPRGKAVVGWIFYLSVMCALSLFVLLAIINGLSGYGFTIWQQQRDHDLLEIGKAVVWLVVLTVTFRSCLKKERERRAFELKITGR
jgi:hypothetical protein